MSSRLADCRLDALGVGEMGERSRRERKTVLRVFEAGELWFRA